MVALLISFCSSAEPIQFQKLSLEEALLKARAENKFVFVDFYAEWCRPCKVMEQEVFTSEAVGQLYQQHFIAIRIDAEKEQQALVNKLEIEAYPTLAFYDPKGRLVFRNEGALSVDAFYDLSESLVFLNDRLKAYNKNDSKMENVHDYITSLKWVNPSMANRLARGYLMELKEKEYTDSLNWNLIEAHLQPWDRVLFNRIANSEKVREERLLELKSLLSQSIEKLLAKAIEIDRSSLLKTRAGYISSYSELISNPDSLRLVGQLFYAKENDIENYAGYLEQYISEYLRGGYKMYAELSYELSSQYFQKDLLALAEKLANQSIQKNPNLLGYMSLSLIQEKLLDYKSAYGFLLLAYNHTDQETRQALDQKEKDLKKKMEYQLLQGVNMANLGDEDGRFTLGAGQQRLMYGYPVPQSTSHFVVNLDGKLASNAPFSKAVTYIQGVSTYDGSGLAPTVSTAYEFDKVTIKQILTPVDKEGNPISSGLAQYYRVEYTFSTKDRKSRTIGIQVLFDTMMDDNDACVIAANNQIIPHEYGFKRNMPDELLFYRVPNDTSELVGSALITKLDATPPDYMVVGRWPYLHNVQWEITPQKVKYGDSAYMLRWSNQTLRNNKPLSFITYYGLPHWKKPKLRLIMKDDRSSLTSQTDIFFENDSYRLDLNAKMKIQELVQNDKIDITGVILRGYADTSGNYSANFRLSENRIAAVGKIFKGLGIPFVPKPFGIDRSTQDFYSAKYGNAFDRKVEIILYYKLKREAAPN